MRFAFTEEQEAWRAEVKEFFANNVTDDMRVEVWRTGVGYDEGLHRKLAEKNWIGLAWPKDLGGKELGHLEMGIFNEEMAYSEAPSGFLGLTVNLLGNSLRVFGTEEQKKRFLGAITRGEMTTSELVTEPEAGSDAANVQMRAVADGDDYVINGTKIFNDGNFPTHAFATVRTDPNAPKHRGVSLFIIDMKSEGLTNVPLWTLGHSRRNQLILEDVRVPRENLLGELNRGWYHIATLLDFERSNTGRCGTDRRNWERMVDFVKENNLARHAWVREKMADAYRNMQVSNLVSWHVASMQHHGLIPNKEASGAKVWAAERAIDFANSFADILGRYSTLLGAFGEYATDYPESEASKRWAPLAGYVSRLYQDSHVGTIAGGTNEIQRLIISRRGLELPR
jgi:hypothetical protein